jgi:kinetochore protein Mis13/DSN1
VIQSGLLTSSRLRSERDALDALLRPPSIPVMPAQSTPDIDKSLLNESDSAMLNLLRSRTNIAQDTSNRINSIQGSLGPSVDAFADGIHKVAQYRNAADAVAGSVLNVCSHKLAEREEQGRKNALDDQGRSPRRDLNSVLRGLSRIDR